jgi:plasmid stabilization system protein ParE
MADGMPAQRVVGFSQFRISSRASADLIEIWTFIADDSVTNAHAFIDKLHETIQVLGPQSGLGSHREELAPGSKSARTNLGGAPFVVWFFKNTRVRVRANFMVADLHFSEQFM